MKLLFIGNSYTYYNDLPKTLAALAEENGHAVTTEAVTKGGWKLFQYLDVRNEYAEKLDALLASEHFDAVFLQEQSLLPATDPEAFLDGVTRLSERLRGKTDRTVLYVTWGRKEGSKDLEAHGWTRAEMTDRLAASYERAAEAVGAETSHVGRAFLALNLLYPEIDLHHADLTHPSALGTALAAAVHYRTLFGEPPASLASLGLDEATEQAFREVL